MPKKYVHHLIPIFGTLIFILGFFYFLNQFYIQPNEFEVSILLLIGFSLIIFSFFYYFFYFIKTDTETSLEIKTKLISENVLKIILIILMIFSFFITPIPSEIIADWRTIGFPNLLRGIIFLIGSMYLPGSNVYSILNNSLDLPKRFKVESFLVKITVYPLISISLLGTVTLLLESFGVNRNNFSIILFAFLIILFLLDFLLQKKRIE